MSVQRRCGDFFAFAVRWLARCAIILACGFCSEANAVSASKFFKPPKNAPARSTAGGIYPYGDQIGLGLYSIAGKSKFDPNMTNMARAAQSGFNLAGPYYGENWRDFSPIYAANAQGMKFTFQLRQPVAIQGLSVDQRPAAINTLSDAAIAAGIREQVSTVLNDPIARNTVARWTLAPEELRYWVPAELRYLKVASQAIRDAEQALGFAHRPMWMYEPGNRNAAALQKTGVYQDIVSKGTYLTHIPRGTDRSGYAIWSYTQIASAAKSLKTTPQAVLQLYQDFTDPKTGTNATEIRRVLRHDAYLALVMGMKGLNIWSMTEQRPNLTTHNEQFQAYASVAQDLTGDLNLQDAFLFGESRSDLKLKITSGIKEFKYTDVAGSKFTFDSFHYLNTAVGTDRYLFLVNSSEQPMDVKISGLPSSFMLDDLFAGTTTAMKQSSFTQRLDVLGVAALRFRQFGTTPLLRLSGVGGMAVPEPSAGILAISGIFCLASRRTQRRR